MKVTTLMFALAIAVVPAARVPVSAASIPLGLTDDFQDGTVMSWAGGAIRTWVSDGGPDDVGDGYLRIAPGGNGHVGTSNSSQWGGGKDYLANGVTGITMDLNNFGPDPLAIRLNFVFSDAEQHATRNAVILPAGSGWQQVAFDLTDMLTATGASQLPDALSSVDRWVIHHDPDPLSTSGASPPVNAVLGVDNITAVPEPGSLCLSASAAIAGLALLRRRRK